MSKRTIVKMPGDGIGKTVLPEAIRVLDAVGFEADYVHADIGWEFWCKEGNPLPQRTLDIIEKHKIALFGAITSKPKSEAAKELDPAIADKGYVYYSPIVGLRQHFTLDICQRPCISFKGNPLNFIRKGPNDTIEEPEVNVVVFRQNTEGLYGGVEWTNPPDQVYDALMTHPKFSKNFGWSPRKEVAVSTRIFTKKYSERICKAAFEYAKKFGYERVTLCEKPNVIRETSGMMLAICRELEKEYEGIWFNYTNIDAQMMWLTKDPEKYGVIIAGNMFGDIVSDGFAGLIGGLGFACSANIGKEVAIFEPTHGSSPKYEELDPSIVNPIAMIMSACMMLDHIGEIEKAARIRKAIAKVVEEGKVRAYDMLKLPGGADVLEKGAASTTEMTDAIIAAL
ncbi:MAG: isocitrate/isopropylmalate dehydrogenase family protein [Candidatus Cloacimonetes bacterium]|nr:isocitrate/isopropylmalate dehydrogenase family protein [Candidatus Cloacimonadota bacterium]MCF7813336.1 isocitrate/isopropylmalate dehydrogenase family protein [Candidatus Cloacimonadota bacterium]MCF7867825.1 isocitrate/isopropylmalate dehydrogenase family protein [Candidatus Cloacimonadota bacterium]MCF7883289.1 isocitrate/isopropylmalate dehydrogenase family protein [Candidatus Cloacimonadota bacterium]